VGQRVSGCIKGPEENSKQGTEQGGKVENKGKVFQVLKALNVSKTLEHPSPISCTAAGYVIIRFTVCSPTIFYWIFYGPNYR